MIEQLLGELKNKVGPELKGEAQVDEQGLDKILRLTRESTEEVAKREVSAGNAGALMSLFGKGEAPDHSNPIVTKIGAVLTDKLVSSMNLAPATAKRVEQIVIPVLMQLLNGKVKQEGVGSLISAFTGGKGGLMGSLGKLGGLFK